VPAASTLDFATSLSIDTATNASCPAAVGQLACLRKVDVKVLRALADPYEFPTRIARAVVVASWQ